MDLTFTSIDKKPLKKILRYLKFVKKATKKIQNDTKRLKTNNVTVRHERIVEQKITEKFQRSYYINLLIKNLVEILRHHQINIDEFLAKYYICSKKHYLSLLNDRIININESKRWVNIQFYLKTLINKSREFSFDYFIVNRKDLSSNLVSVNDINGLLLTSFSIPDNKKKFSYSRVKKAIKKAIKIA